MNGRLRIAVTLLLAVVACGGNKATDPTEQTGTNGTTGTSGPTGNTGGTSSDTPNAINVSDNMFAPSSTSIANGSTVTWTWTGSGTHNITFDNAGVTGSPNKSSGTFQKQFNSTGTYTYQCTNHYGMTGTIIVQ